MKAVFIAKCRDSNAFVVYAMTFDGQVIRAKSAESPTQFTVGDVWDITTQSPPEFQRRLPPLADLTAFIEHQSPPLNGGVSSLSAAVPRAENSAIQFWRPDQPLARADTANGPAYDYPNSMRLPFVGLQAPPATLPAGTLLCVLTLPAATDQVQIAGWIDAASTDDFPLPLPDDSAEWEAEDYDFDPFDYADEPLDEAPPIPNPVAPGSTPAQVLRSVFGYTKFKPLQQQIIDNVLARNDTVAIMPTGGGKSLCYQLPALLMDGVTVVVSPLIALMQDQVAQLVEWGVPALFLNSTLDHGAYALAMRQVRNGATKLLYVAPETLLRPETLTLLDNSRVAGLAIDEAHCISQWGHDFRPEYRQLATVRTRYPDAVCIALTATATERVRQDIMRSLGLSTDNCFISSFDRPNLYIDVQSRMDIIAQSAEFLRAHPDQSGIIYCNTVKQVEALAEALRQRGFSVARYHGQLPAGTRARNQTAFIRDQVQVIVATIAFGMGIDKPDVRFILHAEMPKSMEHYYQQIGRAGRDDLPADCRLLYSSADVRTHTYFINQGAASEARGRTARLQHFVAWAESTLCRRQQLLSYFDEQYSKSNCDNCDNCTRSHDELVDLTEPALMFLSCVYRTGQRFGVNYVVDVLRGSRAKPVLSRGHDRLSTYGIGSALSKRAWQQLANQLIQHEYLVRDLEYGSIRLSAEGLTLLKGKQPFHGMPLVDQRPAGKAQLPTAATIDPQRSALFEQLRVKRAALAAERNVPPYVIFSDRTLLEMVTELPQDRNAFLQIHGVGQRKVEQYSDIFLPLIRDYQQETGIKPLGQSAATTSSRGPTGRKGTRRDEIGAAFAAGWSLDALAEQYGVKRGTVISNLEQYAAQGNEVSREALVAESRLSAEQQHSALDHFKALGSDRLKPVFDALDGQVSYDELRLLRLIYHLM